jgi:NAD(P)H-nitrite reductase large subunit
MNPHFDIVIIGNSAAGLQALQTIRRHSRDLTVAVIDREDCPAYSRVLTPYYIGGKTGRDNLFIVDHPFYERRGITTLFGRTAVELDAERHEVRLHDGTVVHYGQLLLAAGAEARATEITADAVCTLRHLEDADTLTNLLGTARCIAAIGAGLVSIPFLSHAGPEIEKHLIISSNRVFSRVVDQEAAAVLEAHFTAAGLQIHKQEDLVGLTTTDRLELTLSSGARLTADMLLVGKGVVPNTALARQAGLTVNEGVCIDRCCRTAHPHVFAAGDAAEGRDCITGELTVQGNWMTAVEQGEHAALAMLGIDAPYEGSMKNNITEVFGIDVAAVGYCRDDAPHTATAHNPLTGRFRKVFLDERQRTIGAVMIGETNDAGNWYRLVKLRETFPGPALLQGDNRYPAALHRLTT